MAHFISMAELEHIPQRAFKIHLFVSEAQRMPDSKQDGSAWTELVALCSEAMNREPVRKGRSPLSIFLRKAVPKTMHMEYADLTGTEIAGLMRAVAHVPGVIGEVSGGGFEEPRIVRTQ